MPSSASRRLTPCTSLSARIASIAVACAKAREPSSVLNRAPSSPDHATTARLAFGRLAALRDRVAKRGRDLDRCDHAIGAVEAAAIGLAVDMTAGKNPGRVRPGEFERPKDVADAVDPHRKAIVLQPGDELAACFAVGLRGLHAMHAAVACRADRGEGLETRGEAGRAARHYQMISK